MSTDKNQANTTIFVGAASQMEQMLAPAVSDPMIDTGNIGLYGHLSGVFDLVLNHEMQALTALWAATAPGVEENGTDTVVAKQTLSITNTTDAAIDVPVGTTVSTASGIGFTVLMDRRQDGNWVTGGTLGDGSWGHYAIQPGQTIRVTVEANQDGPSGNVLAGAITAIEGVAGAEITGSTASSVAFGYGSGTVTLHNTTAKAVIITSADIVQGSASAGQYAVGRDPSVSGFMALNADGSAYQYVLPPGAQITVPIYSTAQPYGAATDNAIIEAMLAEDAPAGSITGGVSLPAGIIVAASSAITPSGPTSPNQDGTFGPGGPDTGRLTDIDSQPLTTAQGFLPSESNVNVDYSQLWTQLDLANWENVVNVLRSQGVVNVAPIWSDNELSDVTASDAFANIRTAALYGGGLAVDAPPQFINDLSIGDSAYLPALEALFRWCTANGLRSSMILSPDGGVGVDPHLLANTQNLVAELQAAGAMPSQFIMENYSQVAANAGDYFSTTSANSLNAVADWLATVPMTSTASESGLEVAGARSADDIMTGVRPSEAVAGIAPLQPYAETQIFTEQAGTLFSATITCASPGLGILQALAGGSVSAGGSIVTVSGRSSAIQSALRGIQFQPTAGALGNASLELSITDATGTIKGSTVLSVDAPGPPPAPAPPAPTPPAAATGGAIQLGAGPTVYAAQAGDTIDAGAGPATVTAAGGGVSVNGAAGTLWFTGGTAPSTVVGGSGAVTVVGGAGGGVFSGGSLGGNLLVATGGNTTLTGGGSGDALFGAATGQDVLIAGSGRESLIGGAASTRITGGVSMAAVIFTGGDTTVTGGAAGGDTVVGGAGDLTMTMHGDAIFAGGGDTLLTTAATGADSIIGGAGTLTVDGGGSNMIVVGGTGASRIETGNGANEVFAGAGAMTLQEGAGPATVVAGAGTSTIQEGAGTVMLDFVHGAAGGSVTVAGYRPGTDHIALFGYGNAAASVQTSGGNSVLNLTDGTRITLLGVTDPGHILLS